MHTKYYKKNMNSMVLSELASNQLYVTALRDLFIK